MGRSALAACIAGTIAVASGGCGGEVIHLGNGNCPHAQVPASQVVWLGDSWVKVPGSQITGVEDAARKAGAIGPGDAYTDASANGALMAAIEGQYTNVKMMGLQPKVLIMDGGTLDTFTNDSAATVAAVDQRFRDLLGMVAADQTVSDVIYFLMPDAVPGVTELRPLLQADCKTSTVRCHFLDLQPLWQGHPEYTNTVGGVPFPSDAGAAVIAGAIWSIMQDACIAQ